jgi:hypothetical protein
MQFAAKFGPDDQNGGKKRQTIAWDKQILSK